MIAQFLVVLDVPELLVAYQKTHIEELFPGCTFDENIPPSASLEYISGNDDVVILTWSNVLRAFVERFLHIHLYHCEIGPRIFAQGQDLSSPLNRVLLSATC